MVRRSRGIRGIGETESADVPQEQSGDPALDRLLQHLAEELAREYVRLMEQSVADELPEGSEAKSEED